MLVVATDIESPLADLRDVPLADLVDRGIAAAVIERLLPASAPVPVAAFNSAI